MQKILAFLLIPLIFNLPILGYAQTCNGGGTGGGTGGVLGTFYVKDFPTHGPHDFLYQSNYWADGDGETNTLTATGLLTYNPQQIPDFYLYVQAWEQPLAGGPNAVYQVTVNGHIIFSHALTCKTPGMLDQDYILIPHAYITNQPGQTISLTMTNSDWGPFFPSRPRKFVYYYSVQTITWLPVGAPPPGTGYHC